MCRCPSGRPAILLATSLYGWITALRIRRRRINQTGEKVLDYVGGTISPEMETPKLLWLAENMPETFSHAWQFMDLTDFLTWRATGSLSRSICTVTCKWTYLGHEDRWDDQFFRRIGLGVLPDEQFRRIGTEIVPGGTRLAAGLTAKAAADLGLAMGTPVAAGLIDAHAGGVGTVGARGAAGTVLTRMAYVFGTSACTMSTTPDPFFVPGVWGPYFSAMVPGLWLNEGGQSAAGAAIEHLLQMHPNSAQATQAAGQKQQTLADWLASEIESRGGAEMLPELVGQLHVVPEFLGNRAPFADPGARALIAGLDMRSDLESLLALYLAGLCGLGCGRPADRSRSARQGHCGRYDRGQRRCCKEPPRAAGPRRYDGFDGRCVGLSGGRPARLRDAWISCLRRPYRPQRGDAGDVGLGRHPSAPGRFGRLG
ncbi:FGGY-family pentulose kinase [Bradyrhizobium sp. GM7.3]